MPTARPVAGLALAPPEFWRELLGHKTLGFAIASSMAFQTVGIILHPCQPRKGVGMGVLFPFLEVVKVTKPAFPVTNIVRLVLS